ncbi:acyl-CoA dehydrogenase [Aquabacter sp. CN5-332]|uniref:acyl-CoA dehydrogenase n=1 Tax=Aquabacter sp. CN5-332 TaxID=3156608 RepID=UPI0032B365C3
MNQIAPILAPSFDGPLAPQSEALERLLSHIAEGAAERDRERIHPYEAMELIRKAKLGALRLPKADGGGGVTLRELFSVVIRLAAADPNVAHALRNHYTFVDRFARPLHVPNRAKWAGIIAGGALVGLANAELGSAKVGGSPFATKLSPDGGGYRLNGTKYYSTGTLYADHVQVRVSGPNDELASVIIPTDREGVELVDDWDGAGQRLTGSGTTHFRDVRVEPDEVIFDAPGIGYGTTYNNTLAQLLVTAIVAGILRNILADAVALLTGRKDRHFYYATTTAPADDPLLQEIIGEISTNAFAAETLVLAAADAQDLASDARDRGEPDRELSHAAALAAAKAKLVVDDLTIRSGSRLFDVGGASATKRSRNLDRHWRNARTLATHNPGALKARAIGDFELHGTPLPTQGFF